jgi:hypothetical protein
MLQPDEFSLGSRLPRPRIETDGNQRHEEFGADLSRELALICSFRVFLSISWLQVRAHARWPNRAAVPLIHQAITDFEINDVRSTSLVLVNRLRRP